MCWEAGKAEEKPDATFSFVDADFINVASGKTNPQMAFIRYLIILPFCLVFVLCHSLQKHFFTHLLLRHWRFVDSLARVYMMDIHS